MSCSAQGIVPLPVGFLEDLSAKHVADDNEEGLKELVRPIGQSLVCGLPIGYRLGAMQVCQAGDTQEYRKSPRVTCSPVYPADQRVFLDDAQAMESVWSMCDLLKESRPSHGAMIDAVSTTVNPSHAMPACLD